jgi:hypothetical protein
VVENSDYLKPFALQHELAADFQSEYVADGFLKSRHGCQELQFFLSLPVHFTYLRKEQVSFDNLPVSVVHLTIIFWFFASNFPISLVDRT